MPGWTIAGSRSPEVREPSLRARALRASFPASCPFRHSALGRERLLAEEPAYQPAAQVFHAGARLDEYLRRAAPRIAELGEDGRIRPVGAQPFGAYQGGVGPGDRIRFGRRIDLFEQLDQLRQSERPRLGCAGIQDRGCHVDALEADHEVGILQTLPCQGPCLVGGHVEPQPLRLGGRFREHGTAVDVAKSERRGLERDIGGKRSRQVLGEGAPEAVPRADEGDAKGVGGGGGHVRRLPSKASYSARYAPTIASSVYAAASVLPRWASSSA